MGKPARQGSKLTAKGAYMDVSSRRLPVLLTQEAEKPTYIRNRLAFLRL